MKNIWPVKTARCDTILYFIACQPVFKKYKTFSVLIYSYINTSGNWKNEKLCGNTTPAGRSVFTQFRLSFSNFHEPIRLQEIKKYH